MGLAGSLGGLAGWLCFFQAGVKRLRVPEGPVSRRLGGLRFLSPEGAVKTAETQCLRPQGHQSLFGILWAGLPPRPMGSPEAGDLQVPLLVGNFAVFTVHEVKTAKISCVALPVTAQHPPHWYVLRYSCTEIS